MVKEVLDKENLKKAKKSWESIYSEEAWNVLKAETPEEEYIANREAEIKEIKDKIKENKKAVKEVEKKLPGQKEKAEREKKMVEEFSVKRLSEFLSDEELETIKKWREYSELDEIIGEWIVDPLENLIKKIFEWIKDLTDEEKLIIAKYLWNKQIIYVDMHQYECQRGFDCTVGFYYTDFSDEMDKAREVQKNLGKLWLNNYVNFVWDSCYSLNDELYEKTRQIMKEESLSDIEKENKLEFDRLNKEWENLGKKLESIEERKHAVEKYGLPEKEAISLYQRSEDLEWVHDEAYDKENRTLVVLHEYSDYNGNGGTEYWTVISIKRGKNTTKKSFKYRDRYDYRNDNPRHEYKKIKSVKVDWDKVEVTVSRGKSTDTYTFDIAYKEDKKSLSSVEKKEFEESIRKVKERLIVENTRDQKYLASHNFSLRKIPWAFSRVKEGWMGYDLDSELPYDKAKVVYENIIPEKWEAHITILTQKDASWDMWRQFTLIRYIVTPEWATEVDDYNYWELNRIEWNVDKEIMKEFKDW